MRLLFIINTPGQAHTWKHVIRELANRGHNTNILARDLGSTPEVLTASGFQFDTFKTSGVRQLRLLGAWGHFKKCYDHAKKVSPSMVIGFGIDAAFTAARLRKPCIVFIDDDHTPYQNKLTSYFASAIITPDCFRGELGTKHTRVNGYKELAYLHPNYFMPDISILDELNIKKGEKYVILRFNVFDAVHDIGIHGFSFDDQIDLIGKLEKYARVFISPEGKLPEQLEKYRLNIPYNRFHHALYYAQMIVSDTGTATTEAVMLGTPAVFYNNNPFIVGNFIDLNKYDLLYHYKSSELAMKKALELIQIPDLKETWAGKWQKMLQEKVDVGRYLTDFIDTFPNKKKI